jgi:hypothetical protein
VLAGHQIIQDDVREYHLPPKRVRETTAVARSFAARLQGFQTPVFSVATNKRGFY